MDSERRRSRAILPWILVTEALASSQTDTSILSELVKKIPGELRENEGKNARESVCLRILESLSVLEKGKSSDGLSKLDSSARIGPLDSCDDVLRRVQRKSLRANRELDGSEVLERDVDAFVQDKRSRLPKCGLEQLKDVIMKETDLIPLPIKEISGLLNKKQSDGNATTPVRSDSDPIENSPVGDLSSGKAVMSDSATADHEGPSACNQLIGDKEYPHNNASLKRKLDVFCTHKEVEGKDSASSTKRRHVDEVVGGTVQQSGREEPILLREPWVENFCETVSSENVDSDRVALKKYLNSQYSHSQDSLATLNGTEKLCMVCKIGGQLLVCSSESCQRVVHEKCMGVAPTFGASMSFYCPFCAYSQAILEYSESKKKYSLARKALVTFINRDEYRVRNSSNISCRSDQNHLKESEICNKCVEQNRLKNVVSREIENSSRKNRRDKPSLSCDSSSRERARDISCGVNEVALEDKRYAERGKLHTGTEKEQDISNQPPVLPRKPAKPTTPTDVAKSSGEEEKSNTHLNLRVRKQEQQYTYPSIPRLRRKKIPWSNAEEEALKEGIRKFAGDDRQMPWKTILEFGAEIFVKRTATDLKDKWRNICKGSPKV